MKKILSILFVLFIAGSVYAQSNEVITEVLKAEEVSFGQVCYLSAVYQGLVQEDASYEDSIKALYNAKQIPAISYETDSVAMVNLAFIYAQMWNIKGGIMYRATNGSPRYAFKQMKADGVIAEYIAPSHIVSGYEALSIFTACNFKYGKQVINID